VRAACSSAASLLSGALFALASSNQALHEKSAPRAHHSRGREQGSARIGGMSRCVLTALLWLWVSEGAERIQFCNPSDMTPMLRSGCAAGSASDNTDGGPNSRNNAVPNGAGKRSDKGRSSRRCAQ